MKCFSYLLVLSILFTSCDKIGVNNAGEDGFVTYKILKGQQSASPSQYKYYSSLMEQKFTVRFDSSAIYATVNPTNQLDINKLYGFADDDKQHHVSSARIGWRWYANRLELFGYVYNDSVRTTQLITQVPLKTDIPCTIKVDGNRYIFTANGTQATMNRTAKTSSGKGYRLYPFFGGDEMAPQDITIRIRED
ncbi:MAG: hypothetical protein LW694_04500 [Chitinophagaceae bacterium]|jgi:hypothetical protein|nr:hypothetical protein [Chitinophagaceae bacterium]